MSSSASLDSEVLCWAQLPDITISYGVLAELRTVGHCIRRISIDVRGRYSSQRSHDATIVPLPVAIVKASPDGEGSGVIVLFPPLAHTFLLPARTCKMLQGYLATWLLAQPRKRMALRLRLESYDREMPATLPIDSAWTPVHLSPNTHAYATGESSCGPGFKR